MQLDKTTLWTALITPLKPDGNVDYASLVSIVKEQEAAGNGILILGSTGEALNLDLDVKKEIIEKITALGLKVPLMAGVGGHNLKETSEWVNWLDTKSLDAYLMVVPHYAKPGAEGQYHWFSSLMNLTKRPVMLYNVPGRSGKELELKALEKLKDLPNFWAIKEASGSLEKFKDYMNMVAPSPVFCGDDALFYDFAEAGSKGLVSVASNSWPQESAKYVKACLAQKLEEKELWQKASLSLFAASNPVPVKRLMKLKKQINYDTVMPPLSQKDLESEDEIKKIDELVHAWAQGK